MSPTRNFTEEEFTAIKFHTDIQLQGVLDQGLKIDYEAAFEKAYKMYAKIAETNPVFRKKLVREYKEYQKSNNHSSWVKNRIAALYSKIGGR